MGWTGILVPETYGGSDLGYLTFGVILEQLGRQLCASPLFASAYVGASAINMGGNDDQKQRWLPGIVDGSEILTLAVDEQPRHQRNAIACKACASDGGFLLSGAKTFVPEGMSATTLSLPREPMRVSSNFSWCPPMQTVCLERRWIPSTSAIMRGSR